MDNTFPITFRVKNHLGVELDLKLEVYSKYNALWLPDEEAEKLAMFVYNSPMGKYNETLTINEYLEAEQVYQGVISEGWMIKHIQ
jgi:hypothetical protein